MQVPENENPSFTKLSELAGKLKLSVPDGFFEEQENRLKHIPDRVGQGRLRQLFPVYAMASAAAVIAIFLISFFFLPKQKSPENPNMELAYEYLIDEQAYAHDPLVQVWVMDYWENDSLDFNLFTQSNHTEGLDVEQSRSSLDDVADYLDYHADYEEIISFL